MEGGGDMVLRLGELALGFARLVVMRDLARELLFTTVQVMLAAERIAEVGGATVERATTAWGWTMGAQWASQLAAYASHALWPSGDLTARP